MLQGWMQWFGFAHERRIVRVTILASSTSFRFLAPLPIGAGFPPNLGKRLQSLAGHALDENQLNRLAKVIASVREKGYSLAPLVPFQLGILSNSTTDFIVPRADCNSGKARNRPGVYRRRLWPGSARGVVA
jgi:hypothetical protein